MTAEEQSAVWGTRVRDWAEVQEGMVQPLYKAVVARLNIGRTTMLLDVGCGAGLFCEMVAALGANVSGLDATEPFLTIARERVPQGDFRQGDMEDLPFAENKFDIVTGFNAFQFADSPLNALRQARRVLKPEGTLAMAVWGSQDQAQVAPVFAAFGRLIPPPPPGAPGPFALSAVGALAPLVEQAGFEAIRSDEVDCLWVYKDFKTLCRGLFSSGPGAAAVQEAGEAAVRKAITPVVAPFRTAAGTFEFHNRFRYLLAKPRHRTTPR